MSKKNKKIYKRLKKYFSVSVLTETELYVLSFLVIFLLLFTWAGVSSLVSDRFTFNSIFSLHTKPFIWFIDLIILALPASVIFFINYHKIKTAKLKKRA